MTARTAHQIVDDSGQSKQKTHDVPHWFLTSQTDVKVNNKGGVIPKAEMPKWAPVFSQAQPGNTVEFYTTGADYFAKLADAICAATQSVFIAGWQVNYDVELVKGKTLFSCLDKALSNGASVYVMPWLAPPGPIDTGYFPTMLAVFHLNAARKGKGRAYCLPALTQSDQGKLNPTFAHHQKQVVIDGKRAFVGGIDLAYGRRDDARFSLKAEGRMHNEFYSPCIPAIKTLTRVEKQNSVTTAELMAAGLTRGLIQDVATFATSPAEGTYAKAMDLLDDAKEGIGEGLNKVKDAWNSVEVFRDLTNELQDIAMDQLQAGSRWAWDKLSSSLKDRLEMLAETGTANAANVGAALAGWFAGADLSRLPPSLTEEVSKAINAVVFGVMAGFNARIDSMPARYDRLFQKIVATPPASVRDPDVQPRMPWQDIQCSIEGPSAFDLAQNFIRRWNGSSLHYEKAFGVYRNNPLAKKLLNAMNIDLPAKLVAPRIRAEHIPARLPPGTGENWVQLLRSAPMALLRDEVAAMSPSPAPAACAENSCLKGMLHAIHSSQHFLYIEGQFYQTDYHGVYTTAVSIGKISGPLGTQQSVFWLPGYEKYATMLEIKDVPIAQILGKIRWAKIDDVMREAEGAGFINDLYKIIENWAMIEALRLLEKKPQLGLHNPIGKAMINRIERAVSDGKPFHVYLVVPVHPEGTLNTLNLMTQIDHTMRSLVFGSYSLVNGVRRVLYVNDLCKKGMSRDAAVAAAQAVSVEELTRTVGERWMEYLTLLNLRNWDTIGKRPVTEQVYIHSKLLIADDRVAVLGSANINDRSQWGDRDSELAVIVNDDASVSVKLDGVHGIKVGKSVHKLRRELWEKLFGLKSNRPAYSLKGDNILDSPAAPATWREIQKVAAANAKSYEDAFRFIPRSFAHPDVQPAGGSGVKPAGSIWPTWRYTDYSSNQPQGKLVYRMPFDPAFWRAEERDDKPNTWNVDKGSKGRGLAPESAPQNIQGFITALPVQWTAREDNDSEMSLTVLALVEPPKADQSTQYALNEPVEEPKEANG